jgi:hypothetical protein
VGREVDVHLELGKITITGEGIAGSAYTLHDLALSFMDI